MYLSQTSFYFSGNFKGMRIILVLIFISLILALIFLAAFFWAVKNGQYEDDHTPSIRMLWEDKKPKDLSQEE